MNAPDNKGSALLISLIVMTLLTMMSTVFFEKIYRFSKRSNGIENSNVAYYKALGTIEDALYDTNVDKYTPWNVAEVTGSPTISGASLEVSTGGTSIPLPGEGNSPYDDNYNIISLGQPVQIVIPQDIDWTTVYFNFRVPEVGLNTSTGVLTDSGYILWTFASSGASLFASGETNIFKKDQINGVDAIISDYYGTTSSGSESRFDNFYTSPSYLGPTGSKCTGYKCTLKLSLIRPVPTIDGRSMTFLEYKISSFDIPIPSQYMNISAKGYAYGFLRTRELKFPQITTNTALDFAVLQ